jgi:hypothetical protein
VGLSEIAVVAENLKEMFVAEYVAVIRRASIFLSVLIALTVNVIETQN